MDRLHEAITIQVPLNKEAAGQRDPLPASAASRLSVVWLNRSPLGASTASPYAASMNFGQRSCVSCSSGMGAGAAKRLAADGFRIGILSSSGKGEALARDLGGFGVTGSNQSVGDITRLVDGAMDRWGRIDVLVNSAGHGPRGDVIEITDEEWHAGLDVYLLNVIRPTRLVTPIMAAQGGGAIINISTFAAFEPDPLFPTSGIFRAGLAGFAKLYADRYAPQNIRMNNILPGFIDTLPETADRRARIPLGRYGKEEEVSSLIGFLASENGGYVTGQNWRIDGGLTRGV